MVKTTSVMAVAMLAMMAMGCDDGPVKKRVNCISICNKFEDCVGDSNYSVSECKDECKENDGDRIDECQDCLESQDSCTEKLTCTNECSGLGILSGF